MHCYSLLLVLALLLFGEKFCGFGFVCFVRVFIGCFVVLLGGFMVGMGMWLGKEALVKVVEALNKIGGKSGLSWIWLLIWLLWREKFLKALLVRFFWNC